MMSTPSSDFARFQRLTAEINRAGRRRWWEGFAVGCGLTILSVLAVEFGALWWAAVGVG
jgi:hypothetical protein